ncbi:putative Long-chain-fatty-acid--AMP ligase FadD26 [Blattamonas nauphoetae]|uniref:Long-chain-fatty-acid--AMP ligase FadD26 n=1 Tax=Blattamonas nauphoetae TaxID=2049346 RepID=A0ABQ9WZ14_9EUKA|nr:putative Long-chain-fatty-acid--AMP ligase FadD26 [Blattamonas nauphoetae]
MDERLKSSIPEPEILKCDSLKDALLARAKLQPNKTAFTSFVDGERPGATMTFSELAVRTKAISASLQKKNLQHRCILMLYPLDGLEFIEAFFGVVCAGCVAVPCFPPDPSRLKRTMARFLAIIEDARSPVVATTKATLGLLKPVVQSIPEFKDVNVLWIVTDTIDNSLANEWVNPKLSKDSIAFLQYTSGSTGTPKGVMVSHGNILSNTKMIVQAFSFHSSLKLSCWLPLYHDMGLIGNVFSPVVIGSSVYLMSPTDFLKKPYRWLKMISDHRIEVGGGPNFAYELASRKITPEQRATLDLSCLELLYCGSEPVHPRAVETFFSYFASTGLKRNLFMPCYGLAENTLLVSVPIRGTIPRMLMLRADKLAKNQTEILYYPPADTKNVKFLMTTGYVARGCVLRIVNINPPFNALPVGDVGEIWISGPSVAQGYWSREEATNESFRAYLENGEGPFLRTGDLGFLNCGELFICGRVKDVMIIGGKNVYPQDIETTAEGIIDELRAGCSAAFSLDGNDTEKVIFVAEVKVEPESTDKAIEIVRKIVDSVSAHCEIALGAVCLIKPRSIMKTTSGKIQRRATKAAFLANELEEFYRWTEGKPFPRSIAQSEPQPSQALIQPTAKIPGQDRLSPTFSQSERSSPVPSMSPSMSPSLFIPLSVPSSALEKEYRQYLCKLVAERKATEPSMIDPNEPFTAYGIDSTDSYGVIGDLEEHCNLKLNNSALIDYPTISTLAKYLASRVIEESGQSGDDGSSDDPQAAQRSFLAEVEAAQNDVISQAEPIAIVGMSCRFPGANTLPQFWQNLCEGVNSIVRVPNNRWDADAFYSSKPSTPGKMNTRMAGLIDSVDKFDRKYFGISAEEAQAMEPEQRLVLEVAVEAFEDAGIPLAPLAKTDTGVFIAANGSSDYAAMMHQPLSLPRSSPFTPTGSSMAIISNRLSYLLDLRGPSVSIDTACSSSLVALDAACSSIRKGQCSTALVGGVNVILSPLVSVNLSQVGFLSPDGQCHAFDSTANGYVRSEGCGCVVVKPLSAAIRDGDRIYSCIRATSVNQDGKSNGLTAPNPHAQEDCIRRAAKQALIDPTSVQMIEAHGTGTPLGDPIETRALSAVYCPPHRPSNSPLLITAAKSNVGHLEMAAGMVGLIKTSLALFTKTIPGIALFRQPNKTINESDLKIELVRKTRPWPEVSGGQIRLAGLSSFGFGGTNAHVILQSSPETNHTPIKVWSTETADTPKPQQSPTLPGFGMLSTSSVLAQDRAQSISPTITDALPVVIPLSAKSPVALRNLIIQFREYLTTVGQQFTHDDLARLSSTLFYRRNHYTERSVFSANSVESLIALIDNHVSGSTPKVGVATGKIPLGITSDFLSSSLQYGETDTTGSGIGLVFVGQGTHYSKMGMELMEAYPVFRNCINTIQSLVLKENPQLDIVDEIKKSDAESNLSSTAVSQPCLFAIEVALAELLKSWGVVGSVVIGHSIGEIAGAYVSGGLSLEEAVRLVVIRGDCMSRAKSGGGMIAAEISVDRGNSLIKESGVSDVWIGAWNSPTSISFSGNGKSLDKIEPLLEKEGCFFRRLKVASAFHTNYMDSAKSELENRVGELRSQQTSIPFISTVTGKVLAGEDLNTGYFGSQLRSQVNFCSAVETAIRDFNIRTFIEIGPHPALTRNIDSVFENLRQTSNGKINEAVSSKSTLIPTLIRNEDGCSALLTTLGSLYSHGIISPHHFTLALAIPRIKFFLTPSLPLPQTPWNHERSWNNSVTTEPFRAVALSDPVNKPGDPLDEDSMYSETWIPHSLPLADTKAKPTNTVFFVPIREMEDTVALILKHYVLRKEKCVFVLPPKNNKFDTSEKTESIATLNPETSPIVKRFVTGAGLNKDPTNILFVQAPQSLSQLGRVFDLISTHFTDVSDRLLQFVYGWSLDSVYDSTNNAPTSDCVILLHTLLMAYLKHSPVMPRIFLLTSNLAPITQTQAPLTFNSSPYTSTIIQKSSLSQSPLWGYAGSVLVEYPSSACSIIDLPTVPTPPDISLLCSEFHSSSAQVEERIAYRSGNRFVARLQKGASYGEELEGEDVTFEADSGSTKPHGAWIITGGCGGFGRRCAMFLASSGATQIVLFDIAQPPQGSTAQIELDTMKKAFPRCHIDIVIGDICDYDNLHKKLVSNQSIGKELRIRGILHTAGLLSQKLLPECTEEEFIKVLKPKVQGSWNLHRIALESARLSPKVLQHFVLWSSISSTVPTRGEAIYAACNSFLDALCHYRKVQNQPVLCLNWGVISGTGMISTQSTETLNAMRDIGLGATPIDNAVKILSKSMQLPPADGHVMIYRLDWDKWLQIHPTTLRYSTVKPLPPPESQPSAYTTDTGLSSDGQQETEVRSNKSRDEIVEWLLDNCPEHLTVGADEIELTEPLTQYGLTSMGVISLTRSLSTFLNTKISPTMLYSYPTIDAIATHFASAQEEQESGATSTVVAKSAPSPTGTADSIAIVGMSARYPGESHTLAEYWKFLLSNRDGVIPVRPDRWDAEYYLSKERDIHAIGKMVSPNVGSYDEMDKFDAHFFGVSPRDAERMDPQQRLMIECAWEALEDAGIPPEKLAGSDTAVFVGISYSDYGTIQGFAQKDIDAYTSTGSALCMPANRLSYLLDLRGPSVACDSACSSSLSALHCAINCILQGESRVAIVSGVNAVISPVGAIALSKTSALSPTGFCKTFDDEADGFVRSEGCGVVILKPLQQALKDGDRIYSTILATMLNQDGKSNGLTAPNGLAQQALLRAVYKKAGVSPGDVNYIETHGTGTRLGDPVEVDGLSQVLCTEAKRNPETNPLYLGSLKSRIGHTESAAGVASLIKTALVLSNNVLPRNLHFNTPNTIIPWKDYPCLRIPTDNTPIQNPSNGPLLAGLSAFGFGGTNAHVVVQGPLSSWTPPSKNHTSTPTQFVLPLSARSEQSLVHLAGRYRDFLKSVKEGKVVESEERQAFFLPTDKVELQDVCYTAALRRQHHPHRAAIAAGNIDEMISALDEFAQSQIQPANAQSTHAVVFGQASPAPRKIGFVFTGQGSHWVSMGKRLLDSEPVFRQTVGKIDALVSKTINELNQGSSKLVSFSVVDELSNTDAGKDKMGSTAVSQPCLFAIEVALAELLKSWGVVGSVVIGHSIGEIAGAYVSGGLSLEEAVRLVVIRGDCMSRAKSGGGMIAAEISVDRGNSLIKESGVSDVWIGAWNSPTSISFSGNGKSLDKIEPLLEKEGCFFRRLKVASAFHTNYMDSAKSELENRVGELRSQQTSIPFISTVTGKVLAGEDLNTGYFGSQLRSQVNFCSAVETAIRDFNIRTFIEIGPHASLLVYIKKVAQSMKQDSSIITIGTMRRECNENLTLASTIGGLYCAGQSLSWNKLPGYDGKFVRLPTYAWNHQSYWLSDQIIANSIHARYSPITGKLVTGTSAVGVQDGMDELSISQGVKTTHPLLRYHTQFAGGVHIWETPLKMADDPRRYIYDHYVIGAVLVPGVTYIEMGLGLSTLVAGEGALTLTDIVFDKPQFLGVDDPRYYQIQLVPIPTSASETVGEVNIYSRSVVDPETFDEDAPVPWTHHAQMTAHFARENGWQNANKVEKLKKPADINKIKAGCPNVIIRDEYYEELFERGLQLRSRFKGVTELYLSEIDCLAKVQLQEGNDRTGMHLHPTMLDSTLQCAGGMLVFHRTLTDKKGIYLPVSMGRMHSWRPWPNTVWAHVRLLQFLENSLLVNITVYDEEGYEVADIHHFRCRYVEDSRNIEDDMYNTVWEEKTVFSEESIQTVKDNCEENTLAAAESLVATSKTFEEASKKAISKGVVAFVVGNSKEDSARVRQVQDALKAAGCTIATISFGDSYNADLSNKSITVRLSEREDYAQAMNDLKKIGSIRAIIHSVALRESFSFIEDGENDQSLELLKNDGCVSVLRVVQSVLSWSAPPRLFILTAGTHDIHTRNNAPVCPSGYSLWGFGGVIQSECPSLKCTLVDFTNLKTLDSQEIDQFTKFVQVAIAPNQKQASNLADKHGKSIVTFRNVEGTVLPFTTNVLMVNETNVAFSSHRMYFDRVVHASRPLVPVPTVMAKFGDDIAWRLEIGKPGNLQTLRAVQLPYDTETCDPSTKRPLPKDDEVELRVYASGVNFRDVLKSLGLYPAEFDETLYIGAECSGIVTKVGSAVTEVKEGDRVVVTASSTFASYVIAKGAYTVKIPENLSFEQAASLFGPFLTAHYGLITEGRMKKGESVLIHAGSGGVGMAAIIIANHIGCTVYATAGNPSKRELITKAPFNVDPQNVFDSRSLEFVEGILERTNGVGVDLVLNSLAGEGLEESFRLLAPRGRFIEIGKRDIYQNSRLGMQPFAQNCSFIAVAMDGLFANHEELSASILRETMDLFHNGSYQPIPYIAYPVSEAAAAFRFMAGAKHTGKIVLTNHNAPEIPVELKPERVLTSKADVESGVFVVTGGLGGLGQMLLKWLTQRGVTSIAILEIMTEEEARSRDRTGAINRTLDSLVNHGCKLKVYKTNVSDFDTLNNTFVQIRQDFGKIRAVFHLAGLIDDRLIDKLEPEIFFKVCGPKINGSWNLHRATLQDKDDLRYFVLYSSVAAIMGQAGQANYATANSFLNGLAQYRRSHGLPVTCACWGPMSGAGMMARDDALIKQTEAQGVFTITIRQMLTAMHRLMERDDKSHNRAPDGKIVSDDWICSEYSTGVVHIDWQKWFVRNPVASKSPRFIHLSSKSSAIDQSAAIKLKEKLQNIQEEEKQVEILNEVMKKLVASVTGLTANSIPEDKPLNEQGLDSMVAVELRARMEQEIGTSVPIVVFMQGATVDDVSRKILPTVLTGWEEGEQEDEETNNTVTTVYEPEQPNPATPIVALVCQAGGLASSLQIVGTHLGKSLNTRVIAFEDSEMKNDTSLDSVKSIAEYYISLLKEIQPTGPYILGGFSFGGYVAQEMTIQLRSQGDKVSNLLLVDPPAASLCSKQSSRSRSEACAGLLLVAGVSKANPLTEERAQKALEDLKVPDEYDSEGRWAVIYDLLKELDVAQGETAEQFLRDSWGIITTEIDMLPAHELTRLERKGKKGGQNVHTTLILANDNKRFVKELLDLDDAKDSWGKAIDGLDVKSVEGDHWSILDETHSEGTAKILRQSLQV